MTVKQMGRLGGLARAARLQAGEIPVTGAATPKPTACKKCGNILPTHTEARAHCRKKRSK